MFKKLIVICVAVFTAGCSSENDESEKALKSLEKQQIEMMEQMNELKGQLEEKQNEVDNLQEQLEKEQAATPAASVPEEVPNVTYTGPITLIGGKYQVGLDIPAGRFKITNLSDSFITTVEIYKGLARDHVVLGNGEEYMVTLEDGQTIDFTGEIKLTQN